MKKILLFCSVTAITSIIYLACKKEQPLSVSDKANDPIMAQFNSNQSAIPYYSSNEELKTTLISLENKTSAELDAWEQTKGFVSMRKTFDMIVDAEFTLPDVGNGSNGNNNGSITFESVPHAPITQQNKEMLRIVPTSDGSGYFDLNIHDNEFAKLVNNRGFLKVGNYIVQYTQYLVKVITDGDFSKLNLLKTITESNELKHIVVINLDKDHPIYPNAGVCGNHHCEAWAGETANNCDDCIEIFLGGKGGGTGSGTGGGGGTGGSTGGGFGGGGSGSGGSGNYVCDNSGRDGGLDIIGAEGWNKCAEKCLDGGVYNCKWRMLLYETFYQQPVTSGANTGAKQVSYNLKVRTNKKRFYSGGFWWDNWKTDITITGQSTGSIVNCISSGTVDFNGIYYKAYSGKASMRQRTFKEVETFDNAYVNYSDWTVTATDGSETVTCKLPQDSYTCN